jgi:ketosteroid isomerase-like protein
MSDNVTTVQSIYAAFGAGNLPGVLAHLAPDVDWEHDWGATPLRLYTPRRGVAEVPAFFAELHATVELTRFEPQAFLTDGRMVAVPVRLAATVRSTGRRIDDLEMHLWTFGPEGLVTAFRHLCDTRQFAAAGLL